ncbi:MAG: hypothetical protein K8I60_17710 [Anaerolineae bacterium]|nr:hypothetical protein [Anaerolineae bacterium]
MGINVIWDDPEHYMIRWLFDKEWSWKDFHAAVDLSAEMADERAHTVDLILDFTHTHLIPPGVSSFAHIQRGMRVATDQGGYVVLAGGDTFTITLAKIFCSVYKQLGESLKVTSSVDAARHLIRSVRQWPEGVPQNTEENHD